MELIREKFILDQSITSISRSKYFSPLATKFTQKPRQSFFTRYLFPKELKSCSVSPVNIKNYKEIRSISPTKQHKSYLSIKPIEIKDIKSDKKFEFSMKSKLKALPTIQKFLDNNSCISPIKVYNLQPINKKSPPNQPQCIFPSSSYCTSESSTFDTRDSKSHIQLSNTTHKTIPKESNKVKEMVKKNRYADASNNTEDFSLIGWEMSTSLNLIQE